MLTNESFKGMFFLPDNIENEVAGELTFNYDGEIKLELFGSLFIIIADMRDKRHSDAIWGYTFSGQKVSLFDCDIISSSMNHDFSTNVNITVVYNSKVIIHGIHTHDWKDKIYKAMDVSLDYLTEWTQAPYAQIRNQDNKIIITQEQPEDICFDVTTDIRAVITFSHNLPFNDTIDLRVNCHLSLQSQDDISFLEFRQTLQKVQLMFSLFTLNKVRILNMSLYAPKEFRIIRDELTIPTSIKVFYLQPYTKYTYAHSHNFLLVYSDIASNFNGITKEWFRINSELAPIVNILSNHLGEYSDFNESHFLGIIQAVEAFHRRKLQDTEELKKLDKAWKLEILEDVKSDEAMKWLKSKLSFSYEPSLKERLKESFKAHALILFSGSPSESDIEVLIRHIVNTRNYYTHYGNDLEHKKLKVNSMHSATLLLRTLLIVQVLNEISVPYSIIDKAIKPSMRFKVPGN